MNNNNVDPQDIDDIVQAALGELLNLAGGVAELQTTDAAAEEIYVMCDIIADKDKYLCAQTLQNNRPRYR